MKSLTFYFFVITLMMTETVMLFAEPMGTAFTYQGRLLNNNIAAEGLHDLQFKLYDDPNVLTASQIGSTVTADDVDVIDGYFIAQLDFGSNTFNGDARWLQITVRPYDSIDPSDYVALNPLQPITPTPYAQSASEVTGRVRTGGIYETGSDYNTWISREADRRWWSIAMSADGSMQTAVDYGGQIYVSADTGNTWTPKESNRFWQSVAMSADGSIQTAVAGYIYVSTDSGNTWIQKDYSYRNWYSVAMSDDGSIQTAVAYNGQIYVSTDTGNTWMPKESNRSWWSVAMSADGSIQTAVVYAGQIYVSTDTGDTWTPIALTRQWLSVAVSADGSIQTACARSEPIYVSVDSGNTWTTKGPTIPSGSVAISGDGTVQAAGVFGGSIYISTDSGDTWMPKESTRSWRSVAISADGIVQAAGVDAGQIYISSYGRVGIGTKAPTQKLDIAGTARASDMIITGRAGIGTEKPTQKLDVVGTVKATDVIITGKAGIGEEPTSNTKLYVYADSGDFALHASANITSGYQYGLRARAEGATTGDSFGVSGISDSPSGNNYGVHGAALVTSSGASYGVYGTTGNSTSSNTWGGYFNGRGYFAGDVGIGTTGPDSKLHILDSSSSYGMLRIENSNGGDNEASIGFKEGSDAANGDIWIAGVGGWGHANDFVVGRGAAKLLVEPDGDVGIGTTAPTHKLDVAGTAQISHSGNSAHLVLHDSNASVDRPGIQFTNNNIHFISGDDESDEIFGFYSTYWNSRKFNAIVKIHGSSSSNWGNFLSLTHNGTDGVIETDTGNLVLNPAGYVDITGPIYQRGSELHADYVFDSGYNLESVEEHADFMYANKHLKAIPKAQTDENGAEVVEVGAHRKGIVEELEKAHIYINQLNKENKQLRQRLDTLEQKMNHLLNE